MTMPNVVQLSSFTIDVSYVFAGRFRFVCSYYGKLVIYKVSTSLPSGKTTNSYSPVDPALVSRCSPELGLLRITFAPAIAAPVLSVTTPCKDVVPVCAHAHVTANMRTTKPTRR